MVFPPPQSDIPHLKKCHAYFVSAEDNSVHPWSDVEEDSTSVLFCGFNNDGIPVLSPVSNKQKLLAPPSVSNNSYNSDSTDLFETKSSILKKPGVNSTALTALPFPAKQVVGPHQCKALKTSSQSSTAFHSYPKYFDLDSDVPTDDIFN